MQETTQNSPSLEWTGVDLDGTLAYDSGWKGIQHIGRPIWPMVELVRGWLEVGARVKILTARVGLVNDTPEEREQIEKARGYIELWCEDIFGRKLEVTAQKDRYMLQLWDDRCVRVEPNTGMPCCSGEKSQTWL